MVRAIIAAIGCILITGCAARLETKTVAFDNVYNARLITVYASLNGGAEETHTARCNETECRFRMKVPPGEHSLSVAVSLTQFSPRGQATTVKVQSK